MVIMKHNGMGSSVSKELEAIKDRDKEITHENESRVILNFDDGIFKSLKKMLIKVTKASK